MVQVIEMEELADVVLDATGLVCPMPLLKAKRAINSMQVGQKLRILATDHTSERDFKIFSEQSGHILISSSCDSGIYNHLLQKIG